MGIDAGGGGRAMPQVLLNEAEVDACFQQMCGPTVPKSMDGGPLVEATGLERGVEGVLQTALMHRRGRGGEGHAAVAGAGEEPARVTMSDPVASQHLESAPWQWHVTVFGAFAVTDMKEVSCAVQVCDLEVGTFLEAEAAGVDRGETSLVARQSDVAEDEADLLGAEDDGQLLLAGSAQDGEERPVAVKRLLEEELDAADGDGGGAAGVMLDVHEEEEVLAEFFLSDEVRGLMVMCGKVGALPGRKTAGYVQRGL